MESEELKGVLLRELKELKELSALTSLRS